MLEKRNRNPAVSLGHIEPRNHCETANGFREGGPFFARGLSPGGHVDAFLTK